MKLEAAVTIHIHHHEPSTAVLDAIESLERKITQMATSVTAAVERLTADVAKQTSIIDSVLTYTAGLVEQLRQNAENPDQINKLADQLEANTGKLAAAVPAGTPAEEPPAGTEPPANGQ